MASSRGRSVARSPRGIECASPILVPLIRPGDRVQVFWKEYDKFYPATVVKRIDPDDDESPILFDLDYDDGDKEVNVDLANDKFTFHLPGDSVNPSYDLHFSISSPAASKAVTTPTMGKGTRRAREETSDMHGYYETIAKMQLRKKRFGKTTHHDKP